MNHLIYTASATTPYTLFDINLLLAECRLKNTFSGITGILLYCEGSIMQILEGDEAVVQKLYAKIKTDKRHKNILTIGEYKIEKRNYIKWSMAYKEIANKEWLSIEARRLYNVSDTVYPVTTELNLELISIIDSFINLSSVQ